MLTEWQRKTNIGVGLGAVLQVLGYLLSYAGNMAAVAGLLLLMIGTLVFLWGCMNYAEGKGHSRWVGLMGLASIIGLVVLIILPEQGSNVSTQKPPVHKLVGFAVLLLGLGLLVFGRWLDDLDYASISTGEYVTLEHPWPIVAMFLGVCLIIASLVLLLSRGRGRGSA